MWVAVSAAALLLSSFATDPSPWLHIQSGSDQRQPVYLGATPYDLTLGAAEKNDAALLPEHLRKIAERKIRSLARYIGENKFEVELWPTQNDLGQRTWAFARWRSTAKNEKRGWQWLDSKNAPSSKGTDQTPEVFFPNVYRPWIPRENQKVFADVLMLNDLYMKPFFGDCIWSTEDGMQVYGAWVPLEKQSNVKMRALRDAAVCRQLPQPARLDGVPFEIVLAYDAGRFTWPATVAWASDAEPAVAAAVPAAAAPAWPADFEKAYHDDIAVLTGEADAVYKNGAITRFKRKSAADPDNQLMDVVNWLSERYTKMGVQTRRQEFSWHGISAENLIAVLPGNAPDHAKKPVILADHYDTAFAEDIYAKTKRRVSNPGADDNGSGTGALLRAAETLRGVPHARDIWLVHLTGEEFPADDLGARYFTSRLLQDKQDITGVLLMDMIGWRNKGDWRFQINPGDSQAALDIAGLAAGVAHQLAPNTLQPLIPTRFNPESYLFNSDAVVFSDSGLPVVFFDEHINERQNMDRFGYHQSTDLVRYVDFDYAAAIAKVVIQTALDLSNKNGP